MFERAARMQQSFISYRETDKQLAKDLSLGLERVGHSTWRYDHDGRPGFNSWLSVQVARRRSYTKSRIRFPAAMRCWCKLGMDPSAMKEMEKFLGK